MYRLSPIAHKLLSGGEQEGKVNDYVRVPDNNVMQNKQHDLRDLSHQLRVGFRGAGFVRCLKEEKGMEIPGINQAAQTETNILTLRLSESEFMFLQLDESEESALRSLVDKVQDLGSNSVNSEVYKLPRQDSHACFQLSGLHCNDILAKLCAVDLRNESFANGQIAQTSMAHVGVIIVRKDIDELPAYLILVDSSLAEYLWDCLIGAMD